ncbi:YgfZ/GcvT domain-containing protein [Rothia halotolerans]|uniref:CAF17-like 4Fe-4S cluster assembly/insertion protein YgfZ n=1 Tax=Rothia halotolerans TaxID=405770 RepID=UPI00101D5F92|nr:folate-binding protein YgfZ [Rothia halotolerans]
MSRRSPLLDLHGAVEASAPDAGVAAHYGDPVREQRALVREDGGAPAAVDLSHHEIVTIAGEDRASWLTTLSSQVITGLPAGASAETLLLSVQGRIEFAPHVIVGEDRLWLIVEPGQGDSLAAFLDSMRFMLRVEVARADEELAVIGSSRDLTEALGEDLACPVWRDPWPGVVEGGIGYSAGPHPGEDYAWFEAIVPRDRLPELGLRWSGVWAAEALRVEAWRPRIATEADERTIPHELDLLRTAVHLAKGCYKGQETVARVHNLGHPPRRLVFLDLDGSEHTLPARGSAVRLGERTVGRVTSVVQHHEAGPIALAVLKRSADPSAALTVLDEGGDSEQGETRDAEGAPAAVEYAAAQTVIVDPEAGQVVGRRNRADFLR